MITVENLTKKYGKNKVVEDLTMEVLPGEITILLGPNGAGKSTTIKSIAGLLNFSGKINICGYNNKRVEAKKIFGYIPETPTLYEILSIREHITFIRKAYKLGVEAEKIAYEYVEKFELNDQIKKATSDLSKGMQQKTSIVLALMISPKAVLFDEPMIGLDPRAIETLHDIFLKLKKDNISLLISTHIIDTIEKYWDKALIMNKGKIIGMFKKDDISLTGKSLKEKFFELTEVN